MSSTAAPAEKAATVPLTAYRRCKPLPEDKFISIGECSTTKREITLCYQTHGNPSNSCLLLVCGLGGTLHIWKPEFIDLLVKAGFYVVRYDNRDSGCSTHMDGMPTVLMPRLALPAWASIGEPSPPYTLEDMANDGIKLLYALGLVGEHKKAHIFGGSMGGMIAQLIAVQSPQTTASLNILYGHSGGPDVVQPSLSSLASFLDKPASTAEKDMLDFKVRVASRMAGDYPLNEAEVRNRAKMLMERCPDDPEGFQRQAWAIQRSPSRVERLRALNTDPTLDPVDGVPPPFIPTTVIHGMVDTTVPYENGVQLARIIHRSKLVSFPRMGHSIPRPLMVPIVEELALHLRN